MKKELTTAQMLGICLGDFARAILSGLIVTYTLKFFNVTKHYKNSCFCKIKSLFVSL